MKKFISIFFFINCTNAIAQTTALHFTGTLAITKPYRGLNEIQKYLADSSYYEQVRQQKQFECKTFLYPSDGLMVEGFVYKPIETGNKKYPVVFYNRGGTGNFGRIDAMDLVNFHKLASNGFIVFATNYCFVNDKGPFDEAGGSDVHDIFSLIDIATQQPYVDTANSFMFGISRGGMMTYQAIKKLHLNAAAVIAGPANSLTDTSRQSEFWEGWHDDTTSANQNYNGLKNILPDFEKNKEMYLRQRSAVFWADNIQTPVLILHSAKDGRVPCRQSLQLAEALQKAGKEYSLKIYSIKSHSLPFRFFDSYDEIINWFNTHKR